MMMLMQILLLLLLSKVRSLRATEHDKVLLACYIFKLRPHRVKNQHRRLIIHESSGVIVYD